MIRFLKVFIYFIILFADILAMRFFHSYELFIMAVFVVVFPLVVEILYFVGIKKINVEINLKKYELTKGESENINIICKNPFIFGYLHTSITIGSIYYEKFETKKTMVILPIFGGKIKIPVVFENSGKYEIVSKDIFVSDFFGIFKKKINKKYSVNIKVMPKIEKTDILKIGDTEIDLNWAIKNYASTSGDILGVREYIKGDRLNSINWKQTARKDEIMVKEFEKTGSEEYIILFDFSEECLDIRFDNFYSLANAFINNNKSFYVLWQIKGQEDLSFSHITNKKALKKLMDTLFSSYPHYREFSVKNAFKRQFPNSNCIYVGRTKELI
ncbi:MAG: DUF58 domain-containing protein [Lachnospirales bacterium]